MTRSSVGRILLTMVVFHASTHSNWLLDAASVYDASRMHADDIGWQDGRSDGEGVIPKSTEQSESDGDRSVNCGDRPFMAQFAASGERCHNSNKGMIRLHPSGDSLDICNGQRWKVLFPSQKDKNSPQLPKTCLDALFNNDNRGDGMYWLNPSDWDDRENAMQAYCDMSTAGGGWTLVARVTDDFAWVCPEKNGRDCRRSDVDPKEANLFHVVHEREEVRLENGIGSETGIHLKNSIIRDIFTMGRQQVRFTFYDDDADWKPTDDAYACFPKHKRNTLFLENSWSSYSRHNMDYTWNIIKQTRVDKKFSGAIICWGYNAQEAYRYFDEGLHMGSAALGGKSCHLAANEDEIMLKSQYATGSLHGDFEWSSPSFGFLNSELVQVANKKIAIWVR